MSILKEGWRVMVLINSSAWLLTPVWSIFILLLRPVDLQTGKVIKSPISSAAFVVIQNWTSCPNAFGIPNSVTAPQCLQNSSPRNPPSPSRDAAHDMVWIFSGITQRKCCSCKWRSKNVPSRHPCKLYTGIECPKAKSVINNLLFVMFSFSPFCYAGKILLTFPKISLAEDWN